MSGLYTYVMDISSLNIGPNLTLFPIVAPMIKRDAMRPSSARMMLASLLAALWPCSRWLRIGGAGAEPGDPP
jgi:hypothetical protein